MTVRVLLADDHQLVREVLRVFLEKDKTIQIVGETGDGIEVVRLARATHADIVCMDINMPGMNGIETTRRLIAACPDIKVIALSALTDQRDVMDMIDAGASAYVTKAAASGELLQAIRTVRNGQKYFCSDVAATAITEPSDKGCILERSGETTLSHRERQVLQLVAEGHSSPQISALLSIAPTTVIVHRRNIMRKLDLHSVAELTKLAVRYGLTSG